MYTRILIATDGSELAERGVDHGLSLARQLGAEVTIVTVSEPWTAIGMDAAVGWSVAYSPAEEYNKAVAEWARRVLDSAAEKAKAIGIDVTTRHITDSHPADGVIAAAETAGANLIVMASHGRRGLGRLLLGSQATHVLTHSKIPVLIVK